MPVPFPQVQARSAVRPEGSRSLVRNRIYVPILLATGSGVSVHIHIQRQVACEPTHRNTNRIVSPRNGPEIPRRPIKGFQYQSPLGCPLVFSDSHRCTALLEARANLCVLDFSDCDVRNARWWRNCDRWRSRGRRRGARRPGRAASMAAEVLRVALTDLRRRKAGALRVVQCPSTSLTAAAKVSSSYGQKRACNCAYKSTWDPHDAHFGRPLLGRLVSAEWRRESLGILPTEHLLNALLNK